MAATETTATTAARLDAEFRARRSAEFDERTAARCAGLLDAVELEASLLSPDAREQLAERLRELAASL